MKLLKVGLLQMAGCGADRRAGLEKGDAFCRRAREWRRRLRIESISWEIAWIR